jgi:hypothetical protein
MCPRRTALMEPRLWAKRGWWTSLARTALSEGTACSWGGYHGASPPAPIKELEENCRIHFWFARFPKNHTTQLSTTSLASHNLALIFYFTLYTPLMALTKPHFPCFYFTRATKTWKFLKKMRFLVPIDRSSIFGRLSFWDPDNDTNIRIHGTINCIWYYWYEIVQIWTELNLKWTEIVKMLNLAVDLKPVPYQLDQHYYYLANIQEHY